MQSFPAGDLKQQISSEGGGQPRWRRDGKEIYYRALDNRLMVVDITLGARIETGVPRAVASCSRPATRRALDPVGTCGRAAGRTALPDASQPGSGTGAGTAGTGSGRFRHREFTPVGPGRRTRTADCAAP